MKKISEPSCNAIVLAADRKPDDVIAQAKGTPCKALAPLAGTPMLCRVIKALQATPLIQSITLAGPDRALLRGVPQIDQQLEAGQLHWLANARSPSASAAIALAADQSRQPVLLTTADHALLGTEILDCFIRGGLQQDCDFIVGVARLDTVMTRFPGTRRTAIRLKDGPFCGCNLFLFATGRGRQLANFWVSVEQQRKRPWRVIAGALGWAALLRYACGTLTLEQALQQLSRRLGLKIGAVILPFAEAAVDVDTLSDLQLVEQTLAERANTCNA